MTPSAYILTAAATRDFKDAVILGQGYPSEILGKPCKYVWKEVLPLGKYLDSKKEEFVVDPARVDRLMSNFTRAKSKSGFTPFLPPSHAARRGDSNFGFAVDTRKNERGSLEVLCQLVGEDAVLAAARNKVSICTVRDVVDEHGNEFDELIDHVAIIPDPQLNNLESFTPAIAASRGSVPVTSLQLAAQKDESMIDLKKLRASLAAAESLTDEAVIAMAETKIGEAATNATALTTAQKELNLSRAKVTELEGKITAADTKVLELSRTAPPPPPDPRTMMLLSRSLKTERQQAIASGGINPDTAKELDKLLEENGKPNTLALSSTPGSDELLAGRIWQILRNNKPVPVGEKTRVQSLSRMTPSDNEADLDEKALAEQGRAQGKAYAGGAAK